MHIYLLKKINIGKQVKLKEKSYIKKIFSLKNTVVINIITNIYLQKKQYWQ